MSKKDCYLFWTILTVMFVVSALFFSWGIDPEIHESDPAVYERYVEDMRRVGRKPNGELIDETVFKGVKN